MRSLRPEDFEPAGGAVGGANAGPVYRRIADAIRSRIAAGELAPGERLPPIRKLATALGVNRDTVALAYETLAAEGRLESTVGRGTFVLPPVSEAPAPAALPPDLSPAAERLLALEGLRPRYGSAAGAVPMHSLIPDPALYPVADFRRRLDEALAAGGPDLFLYGAPEGHAGLREAIAGRLRREGAAATADEVVLCHGASQGIAVALRLFAGEGDAVAVEEPTYHNVLTALAGLGIEPVAVPMTGSGPDLDALDAILARPEVRAFYTIPSFHNPLGISTGAEARRRLLAVARRHRCPVIEDGFEMDLRYGGRPVPPLFGADDGGLVVHLSSFSKSLFPGVRVGSIAARGRCVEGVLALKHASDLSGAQPLQAALAGFLDAGDYDRHLERLRRVLRARRDALLEALAARMPEGTTWTEPDGGYQVWVELPFETDTRDLLADASRAGVLFAPGSLFLPDRRASRGLRLTFAQCDEAAIGRGVEALARVVRERATRPGGARAPVML